ncbi:MAG: hypothetical protein KKB30_16380 [Proteobacteria bacterium]|nr:hypothetical protein [Pseudomonadota bacterium]MBU1715690.1 hypothetical protein [Pseudomonadota bacterium]
MLRTCAQTIFFLLIFLKAAVGFAGSILPTYSTAQGFYQPIFDPEARVVLYIQRDVKAWDWGPGWEGFSPPAYVRITSDTFRLMQYDLFTETTITLKIFPESPLARKTHRHYQNRIYGLPNVMLRYERESGQLEYEIAVSIIAQPSSTTYRIYRWWNNLTNLVEEPQIWQPDYARMQGLNEDRLRGEVELLSLPGPEGMDCAIVSWDHRADTTRVLVKSPDFDQQYPEGILPDVLASRSEKKQIDHLRTIRSDHDYFYRKHLAEGMRDGEASLAAIDDMQEAGHYPKDPTLTARKLNDHLQSGALEYRVLYQGKLYELRIQKYR